MRLLALTLLLGAAHAADITLDHIVAAVCQVESGCVWRGPGTISGRFTIGGNGELGPWQAMPYTVTALKRNLHRNMLHVDYAETTFRLWYASLLSKYGTPEEALAAYHRGGAGRYRKDAKDYAERCLALAQRLAQEAQQ